MLAKSNRTMIIVLVEKIRYYYKHRGIGIIIELVRTATRRLHYKKLQCSCIKSYAKKWHW